MQCLCAMIILELMIVFCTGGPDSLNVKDVLQKRQHKKIQSIVAPPKNKFLKKNEMMPFAKHGIFCLQKQKGFAIGALGR